jgi:DNA-binding protein HU-beta
MAYSAITYGSDGGEGLSGGREETRMNKADLVARVAQDADLTKRQAEKVVDVLLESIQTALSRGERITVVGFGTFSVMARAAGKGRNPRTGQEIVLSARKTPKFSAGKGLRQAVKSPPQR